MQLVLISHHLFPKTGAHYRFDRLVKYLADSGYQIMWISPFRAAFQQYSNIRFVNKPFKVLPFKALDLALIPLLNIREIKKEGALNSAILVLTFGETNLIAAFIVKILLDAKLSYGLRSNIFKRHRILNEQLSFLKRVNSNCLFKLKAFVWKYILRKTEQIVVQSPLAKEDASYNYNISKSRIAIVENDLPEISSKYYLKENKKYPQSLIFVGNANLIKGFDILERAIPHIKDFSLSLKRLTLVGLDEATESRFQHYEPRGDFGITCIKYSNDLLKIMSEQDLLIVPSREDQFPNVVLEALALGLPVIGSDEDGIAHMLSDPFLLFPSGNVRELLNCLNRVSSTSGYAKAKAICKDRAKYFNFNWEAQYTETLKELMNGKTKTGG